MYFTLFAPVFAFVAAFSSPFSTSTASLPSPHTTASAQSSSAVSSVSPPSVGSASSPPPDWRTKRSIWSPRITSPKADDVWHHGEIRNVTWDTSDVPAHINNRFSIRLGYGGRTSRLFLARDFELRRGRVEVTVPWVRERNYTVVLLGDLGSVSPTFNILY